MSTLKSIIFETLPDGAADEYRETAEALKDLDRQYRHFTNTVWKASKQLLKFDEINRLVAYEVEEKAEKTASAGRSSSGSSRSSGSSSKSSSSSSKGSGSSSTSKKGADTSYDPEKYSAQLPLHFAIKDVLFNWDNLSWESIMAKIVAGLFALSGGILGGLIGGPAGVLIGLTAGLAFGILTDSLIFDWDGDLSPDELRESIMALLLTIGGGILGFVAGGPAGAAIGLVLGATLTFKLLGYDWSDIMDKITEFFTDLQDTFHRRWNSFDQLVQGLWSQLKSWWSGLSLDRFTFRLPHLTVAWQELSADSILARYLGITAIPHLGVEWYARGGIVDGATLIGAGEQGKEAIIPLERHTEWIHMVAVQLKEELEKLTPAAPQALRMIPTAASSLVPYSATAAPASAPEAPDFSSLADTIARAIAELGNRPQREQEIRVYLDGKQLSDAVTRYQRRSNRANGG